MKILLASAELSPLARSGGLGDAVAGLAAALAAGGHDVTVVMPRWPGLGRPEDPETAAGPFKLIRSRLGDVDVLLVDEPDAFDRSGMYGPDPASSWDDAWWQFARFAGAIAGVASDFDVVHLHDAHTGAAALLTDRPTVFTVHNAAHPILGPLDEAARVLGVDPTASVAEGPLEWFGSANYLKAGIVGSDRTAAVSPSFAVQLAGDEESFGMGPVVRSLPVPMVGILNAIDTAVWDPTADPLLPASFGHRKLRKRRKVRTTLLRSLGLEDGVVFGNVGRMTEQKGLGLLASVIDELVGEGFRLVAVGGGDLDPLVDDWVQRHPQAVSHLPFDDKPARLVFGGADAYLMPSQFEPCGLGQMYALRYGAPPVVRLTGGLADTVVDIDTDPEQGNGFGFAAFDAAELAKTIRRAMRYYVEVPRLWQTLQRRGMEADLSWDGAAASYVRLYREAIAGRG